MDATLLSYDNQINQLSSELNKQLAAKTYYQAQKLAWIQQLIQALYLRDDFNFRRLYNLMQDKNFEIFGTPVAYIETSNLPGRTNDQINTDVANWQAEAANLQPAIESMNVAINSLQSQLNNVTSQKNSYLNNLPEPLKVAYENEAKAQAAALDNKVFMQKTTKYLIIGAAILTVIVVGVWIFRKRYSA